ncbi:host attachment family protein [Rhizobium sp. BK376]|uniref:baeRF12 domain-containing protein n=1 Tax=Rhizobium sp. BK376 TaxID=2512149 RepID=UPI00104A855A|nr:host attachment family protein [Rhizobium sp. BK376]TCR75634.1 protein required for attachment to host cells [Rhizobium sp. BK376]
MSKLRIGWKDWVLVCDGARALFLRNDGDAQLLNLVVVDHSTMHAPAARQMGTDRPGRVVSSGGTSRSAVGQYDLHLAAEDEFLADVARKIDDLVADGSVGRLVIVAPPRPLGQLRDRIDMKTKAIVAAEIAKDLTKLPIDEIETHLAALFE